LEFSNTLVLDFLSWGTRFSNTLALDFDRMKLSSAPVGGISARIGPRLAGFPFYSNKLQGIQAKANKENLIYTATGMPEYNKNILKLTISKILNAQLR